MPQCFHRPFGEASTPARSSRRGPQVEPEYAFRGLIGRSSIDLGHNSIIWYVCPHEGLYLCEAWVPPSPTGGRPIPEDMPTRNAADAALYHDYKGRIGRKVSAPPLRQPLGLREGYFAALWQEPLEDPEGTEAAAKRLLDAVDPVMRARFPDTKLYIEDAVYVVNKSVEGMMKKGPNCRIRDFMVNVGRYCRPCSDLDCGVIVQSVTKQRAHELETGHHVYGGQGTAVSFDIVLCTALQMARFPSKHLTPAAARDQVRA
jgi:hypothetical protein